MVGEGGVRIFEDVIDHKIKAFGEEYGTAADVEIDVDPRGVARYAVHVRAPGVGNQAFLPYRMNARAEEKRTWTDCDGKHTQSGVLPFRPDGAITSHLIFPNLIWMRNWPEFDYDATHYFDIVEWEEVVTTPEHTYRLKTIVEWNLDRVLQ